MSCVLRSPIGFPDYAAKLAQRAVGSMPAEFDTFLKTERARWKKVIADNGIKLE